MSCFICGSDKFDGTLDRPKRVCCVCGAMERQRFLSEVLAVRLNTGGSILEIAPLNEWVFGKWLKDNFRSEYKCVDKWKTGNPVDHRYVAFVDECVGMENLKEHFGPNRFDVVLFQHVLEEIEDYELALTNVESVLRERGLAFMEIPVTDNATHLKKNADSFGNVWKFSREQMLRELASVFSTVEHIPVSIDNFRSDLFVVEK